MKRLQSKLVPRIEVDDSPDQHFSIILSDEHVVRSEPGGQPEVTLNYSASGELVRLDIADSIEGPDIPEPIEENAFMSLTNAAERIGVHPSTLRRVAARGRLRTRKFGSELLTTPAWLEEYKRTRRPAGRPRKSA